jgi:hypothetical protein
MNGILPDVFHVKNTKWQRRQLVATFIEAAAQNRFAERELKFMVDALSTESARSIREIYEREGPWNEGVRPGRLRRALADLPPDAQARLAEDLADLPSTSWDSEALGRRPGGSGMSDAGESKYSNDALAEAAYYLSWIVRRANDLASAVVYLGPLRDEPRAVYPLGRGTRHLPVGSRGQFMGDFLSRSEEVTIDYCSPEGTVRRNMLAVALTQWVGYLGIGDAVQVTNRGKLGRSVRLSLNNVERDLTTVGVGASQLLPLVVAVLGAAPRSIVLLEQPELHLHPAVQSRLADFLALARPDLRIVVETHSEYLLTRLRLRVVQQRINREKLSVLFAEQTQGVTAFRRLLMNEMGDFQEWPQGFFDEGERDAELLVRAIHDRLSASRGGE